MRPFENIKTVVSSLGAAVLLLGTACQPAAEHEGVGTDGVISQSATPENTTPETPNAIITRNGFTEFTDTILIAHAGGGIDSVTYTNSREALDLAVAHGFRYIEIDFDETPNGDVVLLHYWSDTFNNLFRSKTEVAAQKYFFPVDRPQTASAFEAMPMNGGYTPLSLASFVDWLADYPDVKIVTDVKFDNLDGLTKIKAAMGGDVTQFVPQIYDYAEYDAVKTLGYDDIILTIYKLGEPTELMRDTLMTFATEHNLLAITLPVQWVNGPILRRFQRDDVPIFLHTINDVSQATRLAAQGVSGLYTDFLAPDLSVYTDAK